MKTKLVLILFALPALCGTAMVDRVDELIDRWHEGDAAARKGVVAETLALGEPAIAELFRRLTPVEGDAEDAGPGIAMSPGGEGRASKQLIQLRVRMGTTDAELPARTALLTDAQRKELEGRVEYLTAPRLTVYDQQRARVTVVDQKSYVRTYDEGRRPVQGKVSTGRVLDVRPVVSTDGRWVTLELRVENSELARPIAAVQTPRGEVGVPEVLKRETGFTITMPAGATSVLAIPGPQASILEINAEIVEIEELREELVEPGR